MTAVVSSIFALLAACGVPSGTAATPAEQPDKKPPDKIEEGQHFCCFSIDVSGKGSGDGCTAVNAENINTCDKVLYCNGNWGKDDGKVTCL